MPICAISKLNNLFLSIKNHHFLKNHFGFTISNGFCPSNTALTLLAATRLQLSNDCLLTYAVWGVKKQLSSLNSLFISGVQFLIFIGSSSGSSSAAPAIHLFERALYSALLSTHLPLETHTKYALFFIFRNISSFTIWCVSL